MARFGKPDATGRSSGKLQDRYGKHLRPPSGEPWTWQTRELLMSDAWRAMSINARRILDRIRLEHMAHAGQENGALTVTHDNFYAYGVPKDAIRPAIDELVFLGLVRAVRGGRWAGTNRPSIYRITWIGDRDASPPTNEWKGVAQEQIDLWRRELSEARKNKNQRRKKQIPAPTSQGTVLRVVGVSGRENVGERR